MGRDIYFLFLLIRDGFFKVADGRLFQKLQNLERGKIMGEVELGRMRPGELASGFLAFASQGNSMPDHGLHVDFGWIPPLSWPQGVF